ncbi:DUF775 domain-containing protein [Fusarium keratoplasticum]|uniref:DUF775 domain-containing protein n=1 Tax=Fusarium keratoplasticum TaxID=1328300 RepID=A0ACC0QSL9_9HYPO|nr:DUF775 domain-containing protein [Fusarium keratoplasticum]KAI8666134.1 DUF775 domain-containing protein [Fusarium keratoplasticum]
MSGPLFGIVPAGQPLITEPASAPSPTSFLYSLPTSKSFSHIVVFMLPGVSLPPNTAAAIYLATAQDVAAAAQSGGTPNFRFLGGIGPGKESAMFKVSGGGDASGLMVGVSVEPEESVGQRLQELAANKASNSSSGGQPSTTVLAQRIIQNAFNFLSSFSGTAGPGGVEVVPLKAFEDWWRKFESRVRADPSFLEKQSN